MRGAAEILPPSPGEVLRDDFLVPSGLTQDQLAKAMKVSRYSINQLINDRRSITADMALRLGKVTGMTPEFWLSLQNGVDLATGRRRLQAELNDIKPLLAPPAVEKGFGGSSRSAERKP